MAHRPYHELWCNSWRASLPGPSHALHHGAHHELWCIPRAMVVHMVGLPSTYGLWCRKWAVVGPPSRESTQEKFNVNEGYLGHFLFNIHCIWMIFLTKLLPINNFRVVQPTPFYPTHKIKISLSKTTLKSSSSTSQNSIED